MIRRLSRSNPLFVLLALMTALVVAGVALDDGSQVAAASRARKSPGKTPKPPKPSKSDIHNIVIVMMENRSFDHVLGWHPTADAMQDGLSYADRDGALHETYPLAPDFMGCGHPDPDHTWEGGRIQLNGGAMDGFLRSGENDEFAIGYYDEDDRPFINALARNYTTCDRFFSSILSETYPNRIFMHAAQTDRLVNELGLSSLPTIWDRLLAKGVSSRYYFSDLSFLTAFWGTKYVSISRTYSQFLADAAQGTLPRVAMVDPRFLNEDLGTTNSDHPHGDVRAGDAFLSRTFRAVARGPQWRKGTIFIVTYDEWGGFFDHVPPPRAVAPNNVDPDIVNGKALLGFRVPTIIASPFTRGSPSNPRVVSTVFDFTSILKLIEWRFDLRPLTARDASNDIGNLRDALDFRTFDPSFPNLPVVSEPNITLCNPLPTQQGERSIPGIPIRGDAPLPETPQPEIP